jgi:hypothetical protein
LRISHIPQSAGIRMWHLEEKLRLKKETTSMMSIFLLGEFAFRGANRRSVGGSLRGKGFRRGYTKYLARVESKPVKCGGVLSGQIKGLNIRII